MFKTKEELMKGNYLPNVEEPTQISNDYIITYNDGLEFGIIIAFKFFAERLEIYKKYKAGDETIPNWLWDKFAQRYPTIHDKLHKWEDWLFDYCFGDIIRS